MDVLILPSSSTFKNIPIVYLKQLVYILNMTLAKIWFYVSTNNHFFPELLQKLKLNFWSYQDKKDFTLSSFYLLC